MRVKPLIIAAVSLFLAAPAQAYDWYIDAKVSVVESDYMPGWIAFSINAAGGSCASGSFLTYYAQGATSADKQANVAAVLASLMTAQASNKTVRIYGNNTGCSVTNIWNFNY